MGMQLADMSSNIPRSSQGQESTNASTAYEIQQRLERAGKYIGRVISNVDAYMEPMIMKFYYLNMVDPNVDFEVKFPGQVKVQGFESYESRVLKVQKLMATMQLFSQDQNLYSRFKPDWIMREIIKSNDVNPNMVMKNDEEMQADAEMAAVAAQREEMKADMEAEKTRAEIQVLYAERDKLLMEVDKVESETKQTEKETLNEDKSKNEKK
jgi:hypothetical protein